MKIRNGFVSNSSSSSFILKYDFNQSTTDPNDVVDYVKKHPHNTVIINGFEHGEGEDVFELDEDMKSLIRKFPEEFIHVNTGTKQVYDYSKEGIVYKDVPKIEAYFGNEANLIQDNIDYWDVSESVDMSDIGPEPYVQCTIAELMKLTDVQKEEFDNWNRIREERIEKTLKEERNKVFNKYKTSDTIVVKQVDVSYNACDDIYDFKERYLSTDYEEDYDDIKRYYKYADEKPYALVYEDILTGTDEIISYLKSDWKSENLYLSKYNQVFESDKPTCDIDLYQLENEEIKYILKHEDDLIKDRFNLKLFIGCDVYKNNDTMIGSQYSEKRIQILFGRVAIIRSGQATYDFEKTFFDEKDS